MARGADPAVDQHVGNRVRMRRKMLGLTLQALAGALDLTFQQVQKYENGKNRVSASRLQHISQILKVPVAFFFEGAPGGVDAAPATPAYVKAFMRIEDRALRLLIVGLVEDCAEL
jgi:transcriptional regulator with XRE-family HTH domain